MAKITINNIDYDTDTMSVEARNQLSALQFCQAELQRLQSEASVMQVALNAYGASLNMELSKSPQEADSSKIDNPSSEENGSGDSKKKGLFGMFSK